MQQKRPKDTATLRWTKHAVEKMHYYGLSEARVKRIIENPERREEGVAENTVACMQTTGGKRKIEIWVMYTEKLRVSAKGGSAFGGESQKSKTVVSAWRYPGQTKPRDPVLIPDEVARHLSYSA